MSKHKLIHSSIDKDNMKLVLLNKKIITLRSLLIKIEKLKYVEDRVRFSDIISGLCVFLENELDPDLH